MHRTVPGSGEAFTGFGGEGGEARGGFLDGAGCTGTAGGGVGTVVVMEAFVGVCFLVFRTPGDDLWT
jgi:hypothetical protein